MTPTCNNCGSSEVERRGTRVKDGESYQRIKCLSCKSWSRQEFEYDHVPTHERSVEELSRLHNAKRILFTSVQNDTPLDTKFWKALKHYAKHMGAELAVGKVLYCKPHTGVKSTTATWPPEVENYLIENEVLLPHVRLMAHVKITATAVNPLSGLESLSAADSALFPHPQIQAVTVATPQKRLPKWLQTTGTCSVKSYDRRKTGIKGDHHHSLGAIMVEIDRDGGITHIRGITGDNQSEFYDIDCHVTHRGVKKVKAIEAIVLGDEHEMFNCPLVRDATFDDIESIVNVTRPKYIVRHDVIDSFSISHHHKNSPSIKFMKHIDGLDKLDRELDATARFLEATTPKFSTSVVVPSNHHNHITRWLEESDWKAEPWNARLYHELWAEWLAHIEARQEFDPFTWWMQQNCNADVIYLKDDYPFLVKSIYLGFHGDRGSNGTKGSIKNFAKIGAKTVIGHTHSPGIEKGCFQVGTSSELSLEYTKGPSSWMNTHCLIHANGKRQLINIINGEWRLA